MKLYQRSGFDFNQEICSLFIKVCTESGKPELAADLLSKHEERIGSWLTRKSMTNLINQLVSNENGVGIASKVIVVSWMKGVYAATPEIVELVKSAAEKSQSIDDENVQNMLSLSAEKLSKIAA